MNEIKLNGFDAPTIATTFEQARDKAIKAAAKLGKVTSTPMEELTVEALAEIQRLRKGIIQAHKDAKVQPLRLCQALDDLKNSALEPLTEPEQRLKKGLGEYAEEKRLEALALERERLEQIQKEIDAQNAAQEAAAKAAKAQADAEAEQERLRIVAATAKTKAAQSLAEKAAEEARQKAIQCAEELRQASAAAQASEDAIRTSAPIVPIKAKGAATKFKFNYRVTNMVLLYKNHPDAVELSEKKSVLNMLINAQTIRDPENMPKIEGLEIWRQADITTRSKQYA